MGADVALRVIDAQDVQQLGEAHFIGLVDHFGYVGLVGMEPFRHVTRQHFDKILMKNGKNIFSRDEKENDMLKDKLAGEHDITVIRIDCRESERNFIQKNLENSILSELFDLSKVDWNSVLNMQVRTL